MKCTRILVVLLVLFFVSFSFASAGEILFENLIGTNHLWIATPFWGRGPEATAANGAGVRYRPLINQEVCTAKFGIYRYQNPTDNLVLTVQQGPWKYISGYGKGGMITGPVLGTATIGQDKIANVGVGTSTPFYTSFPLSLCINLTAGIDYYFLVTRTQPSAVNGYISQFYSNITGQTGYMSNDPFTGYGGWFEYSEKEPAFRLEGPDSKEPVIIVPGILGSRLNRVSDGEEVWPSTGKMVNPLTPEDNYLDELMLDKNGKEILDVNSSEIIESVFSLNQYGNLIQKFKDSGYQLGRDLFVVPYDWRLDIASSSHQLDSVMAQALINSRTGKVNIIAHSMGGILVKDYLMINGDSNINKLIFAGTPHLGAPKAFNLLNWGDDFDLKFLWLGLNKNKAKDIGQNMPAVYELLPSQEYFAKSGPYVKDETGADLSYNKTSQLMVSGQILEDHRNPGLLSRADDFHQSHDAWLPQSANIYNLLGCRDYDTIGSFILDSDGSVDISSVTGDGTVPLASAEHIPGQNYFVAYPQTKINHVGLISDDRTIGLIYNIVSSRSEVLPFGISRSSSDCDNILNEVKRLRFSAHSPVNLHVYDTLGRHTGLDAEGNIETNIPDSSFTQVGDNTFIFVSESTQYSVKIDAYATGSFDFKIKDLKNGQVDTSLVYENILIKNPELEADFNFTDINSLNSLDVDQEGDGQADIGYSLDGYKTYYHDQEPPIITLIGDQIINLNVHESYADEGASVTDYYDSDVFVTTMGEVNSDILGSYAIHYNAVDASGNQADEVTRIVNIVDTEKPIITLNGSNPVTVPVHAVYEEEGAVVSDNYDNDLTPIIDGTVDVNAVGSYALHYKVVDSSGNIADPVDRIINVVDTQKPAINLNGENPQIIEVYGDYTELGAMVSDNFDIGLIPAIDSSDVNTAIAGSYKVFYNVTDSSGNQADAAERLVEIVDTTDPEITLASLISGEYTRSTIIPINYAVTDNYNLVDVNVTFDGQDFASSDIDLLFIPLGAHSLVITAHDEAGNVAIGQVDFTSIATISSVMLDLERIYTLGWTDGTVKSSLKTLLSTAFLTKTAINSQGKKIDSILGTAFLKQLEKEYNKDDINKQAYSIIKEDILWLVGN